MLLVASDGFRVLPSASDGFRVLPIASDGFRVLLIASDGFRVLLIASDGFRCENSLGRRPFSPLIHPLFHLLPTASNCFQLLPIASNCFQLLPTASNCCQLPTASDCFSGQIHPLFHSLKAALLELAPSSALVFLCRSSGLTVRRASRELRELGLPGELRMASDGSRWLPMASDGF